MRISKLVLAVAFAAMPVTAQAQYFSNASAPNRDGTPFWDVNSADDGRGCNIGYVLGGSMTACNNVQLAGDYVAPYDANLSGAWYLHANGNQNSSWGFGFIGAGAQITYYGGIAGANPLAALAVRDVATNTVLHVFNNANRTFTVAGGGLFDIGIAMYSPYSPTPNVFSWTSAVPNQFAVFGNGAYGSNSADCGTSGCWVGAEDMLSPTDYDYNDGVLQISGARTVVPEPSTYLLMATGLLGLGLAARRRKNVA